MRAALVNGRINPPRSYREALARHRQLLYEIGKVETQLADPSRIMRYPTAEAFDRWKDSARHALKLFRAEAQQIGEWMSSELPPNVLLKDAYDLLKTLEREVDDFTPEEHKVIEKLDDYFTGK